MRFAALFSVAALLRAQETPHTKPSDYPAQVQMGTVTLASEYLVHSLPTPHGTLIANDYLVVEVAFFGPSFSRLRMSPDNFKLRINGKGDGLSSEAPGMVSGSIKFPSDRPHIEAGGSVGVGDGTVSVGPRPPPSQFPGDGKERLPANQPATIKTVEEDSNIDHRVLNAALPEGEQSLPRSGLLYFYYRGRAKNIRSLELSYDGAMGKSSLKLLP
jgi:hypothetical protein